MKDKYYYPQIEEIRIGYQCEVNDALGYKDTYVPIVIGFKEAGGAYHDQLCEIITMMDDGYGEVRVPYLTREGIESEGWVLRTTNNRRWWYDKEDTFFECPMTEGYQIMRLELMHDPEFKAIRISAYYRGEGGYHKEDKIELPIIFKGNCPCINTFRQIQKLLNI